MKIEVILGNIVKQHGFDAVVNSANANLRLGSGVAGAIHTAAGPRLEAYCRPYAPLELGKAIITPGFDLPNKWVIHVRAANYLNDVNPDKALMSGLTAVFDVAKANNIKTLALPAIGTGLFKFPPNLAAEITANAALQFVKQSSCIEHLRICVISNEMKALFEGALRVVNLDGNAK